MPLRKRFSLPTRPPRALLRYRYPIVCCLGGLALLCLFAAFFNRAEPQREVLVSEVSLPPGAPLLREALHARLLPARAVPDDALSLADLASAQHLNYPLPAGQALTRSHLSPLPHEDERVIALPLREQVPARLVTFGKRVELIYLPPEGGSETRIFGTIVPLPGQTSDVSGPRMLTDPAEAALLWVSVPSVNVPDVLRAIREERLNYAFYL
ncbi:hypothetical protein ACUH92_06225 [Dermabacteraceae bacterium CCM 9520]